MRYGFALIVISAAMLGFTLPALAGNTASEARFFSSIADMPLMPGLIELPDQAVMFDKPEGRIIESVAEIESAPQADISRYYAAALPQLGWNPVGADSYRREGEHLRLSFETLQGHRFLRVIVTPEQGGPAGAL